MNKVNIFGVYIDDISTTDAVTYVSDAIRNRLKYSVFTPNPEFIVLAQEDKEFKEILNKADLNIPDGAGLRLTGKIKNTTSGVDLMEELCKEAAVKGWSVGLLGGREGVAKKTAEVLKKRYPKLKVVYAESGPVIPTEVEGSLTQIPRLLSVARDDMVDILFVAFGQGKQERWIYRNRSKVNSFVFMGVGGSFDYIAGNVKRAPKWMRELGMEWLFRLIMQPWRIKRQLKLLKFIWLVITRN